PARLPAQQRFLVSSRSPAASATNPPPADPSGDPVPRTARRLLLCALALSTLAGAPLARAAARRAAVAGDGAGLPSLSAADRLRGGEGVLLRGLSGDDTEQTDLGIVTLSAARSTCSLALTDAAGAPLAPPVRFTMHAGESRPFVDALGAAAVPAREATA